MKRVIFLLSIVFSVFAKESVKDVSRGALIEGTFIVQNKLREVKETIQGLKKELTACSLEKETAKKVLTLQERLVRYHCKLKQLIYPWYIDELARLYEQGQKYLNELEKESLPNRRRFEHLMEWTHYLHEKIAIEKDLLASIFEKDKLQIEALNVRPPTLRSSWFEKPRHAVPLSTALLDSVQKKVSQLKTKSIIINAHVFIDGLVQEVFLDKLAFFKG